MEIHLLLYESRLRRYKFPKPNKNKAAGNKYLKERLEEELMNLDK